MSSSKSPGNLIPHVALITDGRGGGESPRRWRTIIHTVRADQASVQCTCHSMPNKHSSCELFYIIDS